MSKVTLKVTFENVREVPYYVLKGQSVILVINYNFYIERKSSPFLYFKYLN